MEHESRLRNLIDLLTDNAVEQLCREREMRKDLQQILEGMPQEERIKLATQLAHYAYDRLVTHRDLPPDRKASWEKTRAYFAHRFDLAEWYIHREQLLSEWDELEEEFEDLKDETVSLLDDDEDDVRDERSMIDDT